MTRRIVQISSYSSGIDVLCDDGSTWNCERANWTLRPDIPQDTPAESPDPIAELEAMGGTIQPCWIEGRWELTWFAAAFTAQEPIGEVVRLADIRAAAARLLARVRGAKS